MIKVVLFEPVPGDIIRLKIKNTFKYAKGITWSPAQMNVFEAWLTSICPIIYGDDWERVKQRPGFIRSPAELFVRMPRRYRKSLLSAWFAALALYYVPAAKVLLLHSSHSSNYRNKVFAILAEHIDPDAVILRRNAEQLTIGSSEDERDLHVISYSRATRATFGPNILICDDLDQPDPAVFYKTIVPLMQLNWCFLVAFYTMDTAIMGNLRNLKREDGGPYFRFMLVDLEKENKLKKIYQNDPATAMKQLY